MSHILTDRAALMRSRHRAQRNPALFLHEEAIEDVQERLGLVNRTFTAPAVVTGHAEVWSRVFPSAKIVNDADVLDLNPEAHDLVIHGLSMHWANDPVGQLVQCRRALKPDGLFIGLMFGGQTLAELRAALAEAEVRLTGGLSPRILPMGEIRDLGALLQRAGFALPVADSVVRNVSYGNLQQLLHDLRNMAENNVLAARNRRFAPRNLFREAERIYQEAFALADGRLPATFELIGLTGWAPHPDQQKPLRPGSAVARLADALKTEEINPEGDD